MIECFSTKCPDSSKKYLHATVIKFFINSASLFFFYLQTTKSLNNTYLSPALPQSVGHKEVSQEARRSQTMMDQSCVSVNLRVLINKPKHFQAGKISQYYENWLKLTSDKSLLDIVKNGYDIVFESESCSRCHRQDIKFNKNEKTIKTSLLSELFEKHVIEKSIHEQGEIISNIFVRPNPDGSHRFILNLSHLNDHVEKVHFKMENLKSALQLVKRNCFFGKVDLKDVYFSCGVNHRSKKYLKFLWQGELWVFTCLANGLSPAPRVYTKLLKIVSEYDQERPQSQTADNPMAP